MFAEAAETIHARTWNTSELSSEFVCLTRSKKCTLDLEDLVRAEIAVLQPLGKRSLLHEIGVCSGRWEIDDSDRRNLQVNYVRILSRSKCERQAEGQLRQSTVHHVDTVQTKSPRINDECGACAVYGTFPKELPSVPEPSR